MSGAEAAATARRLRPGLPIIFASGNADKAAVQAAVGADTVILRKPFNMEELARAVAAAAEPADSRCLPPDARRLMVVAVRLASTACGQMTKTGEGW